MTLACRQQQAAERLAQFASTNVPLAPLTTYKLGGPAAVFASPRDAQDLELLGDVLRSTGLPLLVVGRGSNLLVADAGFPGIAISLAAFGDWVELNDAGPADTGPAETGPADTGLADTGPAGTVVTAGAAVALPVLARRCAAAGLTGFEWAVGVPGSIGGAVRMNAGGHGSDIAASLVGVHVVDLLSGVHAWVPTSRLGLRFRGSDLADHQVVLDARLQLARGDVAAAEAEIVEIVRWRREHQPGGQNAGSVFVNPIPSELPAAVLIDQLSLRGFAIGGATVSEKHANFIQASPGATAADVRAVMEHVRAVVHERTGFMLRSELKLVGFDSLDGGPHDSPHDSPHDDAGVAL